MILLNMFMLIIIYFSGFISDPEGNRGKKKTVLQKLTLKQGKS
jgi:hypothetical protein